MVVGENLKVLRKRKRKSQEEVAMDLGFNRSTYSGYENNIAQPNLENLLMISKYYDVSIESLLCEVFADYSEADWQKRTVNEQNRMQGNGLRVLSGIVNQENEEVVEVVPVKASAGYTSGYADPEYFQDFPTLSLPFLSKNKKYRAFPIKGDSMPPVSDGSIVVGEFLQDWTQLKSGNSYLLVSKTEGIVFKKAYLHPDKPGLITLVSSNIHYQPYDLPFSDLVEVWKFVCYVATKLPEVKIDDIGVMESIRHLQVDVKRLLQRK
jgi:transcriptional regulator with XRE-family HTH domain